MALKRSGLQLVMEGYSQYMMQLREINKANREAFKPPAGAGDTWDLVQKLRQQATGVRPALEDAAGGAKLFGISLMDLNNFLAGLGFAKLINDAKSFIKTAGDIAQRNETLRVSLEEVGAQSGYSAEQVNYAIAQLKDIGITESAASQSLLRMARANISWANAAELARAAQGSAVVAGISSSEAFNRLVTGIQKQEPELLDELGITLRREKAYEAMAQQLGKTTKELTDQEKTQAILNNVLMQTSSVMGVYEKAQATSGKQQQSLTRYIEESQAAIGQLVLPFREVSVQMQTEFWKGIQKVALGLKSWVPIIREIVKVAPYILGAFNPLFQLGKQLDDMFAGEGGVFERMGRGAHDWARVTLEATAMVKAGLGTVTDYFQARFEEIANAWDELKSGDIKGALEAIKTPDEESLFTAEGRGNMFKEFQKNFNTFYDDYKEKYPDIFKSWEELNAEVAAVDLNPAVEQNDDLTASYEEQIKALEAQIEVFKQVDAISKKYMEDVKAATDRYSEALKDLDEETAKARTRAAQNLRDTLSQIDEESSKQAQEIKEQTDKNIIQMEKDRNKEVERERRRFELQMIQSLRRFQLEETRLQAEGDILGLQRLREDFALSQQEAKENRTLDQDEGKEDFDEAVQGERDKEKEALDKLDEQREEQKKRAKESYDEELSQLQESNKLKKEELDAAYEEQLKQLEEAKIKQLEELGRSLQDQEEITKEGMDAITAALEQVYGESNNGDALIQGWTTRSRDAMEELIADSKDLIKELEDEMNGMSQNIEQVSQEAQQLRQQAQQALAEANEQIANAPTGAPRLGTLGLSNRTPQEGMREGGFGIVNGPRNFHVEPGAREMVLFAPLPRIGRQSLDVNMRGGFDIRGAEVAGKAAAEAAIMQMIEMFSDAVDKLGGDT